MSTEKDGLKLLVAKMRTEGSSPDDIIAWLIDSWAKSREQVNQMYQEEEDILRAGYSLCSADHLNQRPEDVEAAITQYIEAGE